MDPKKNEITMEDYYDCCVLYCSIVTSRHSSQDQVKEATIEFQKVYVRLIDQGSHPSALKNVLNKILNATIAQIDESDRLI
tara:strand:+ start:255 stop:497 length:243 start_codon:yes stop_codon:yes gene_type:complete